MFLVLELKIIKNPRLRNFHFALNSEIYCKRFSDLAVIDGYPMAVRFFKKFVQARVANPR